MEIKGRKIGKGFRTYIIAEMSANHAGDISRARKLYVQRRKPEQTALKYRHIRRIH